jgi:hypothetical protein
MVMAFKNFLISITKSLIVLVIATFVFSTVTLDFPDLIKGVFGDIFSHASPEAQKQVVGQLAETCSSLEQGNAVTIGQICGNASMLNSMKENCANYRELKRRNVRVENEQQVMETCQQIESGELERQCNEMQNSMLPDFSKIGALCKDYRSGKINDKEFFYNVIGGALPGNLAIDFGFLDKYNKTMNFLNNNKLVYFVILAILLLALYSLIMEPKLFLSALGGISLSLGLLIMLPYFAILAYEKFFGFDTTPVLGSMFGSGNLLDPKAMISVILLMFLRTYNAFIITIGIILLTAGTVSKTHEKIFDGIAVKEPIHKKGKKVDKLFDELKDSMKKDKNKP